MNRATFQEIANLRVKEANSLIRAGFFAEDCNIVVGSERAGKRVIGSVARLSKTH